MVEVVVGVQTLSEVTRYRHGAEDVCDGASRSDLYDEKYTNQRTMRDLFSLALVESRQPRNIAVQPEHRP